MTVVPSGADAASCITDEIVEAAIEARKQVLMRPPSVIFGDPLAAEEYLTRKILEAVALMIVAAWQHAEEDLLDHPQSDEDRIRDAMAEAQEHPGRLVTR